MDIIIVDFLLIANTLLAVSAFLANIIFWLLGMKNQCLMVQGAVLHFVAQSMALFVARRVLLDC